MTRVSREDLNAAFQRRVRIRRPRDPEHPIGPEEDDFFDRECEDE